MYDSCSKLTWISECQSSLHSNLSANLKTICYHQSNLMPMVVLTLFATVEFIHVGGKVIIRTNHIALILWLQWFCSNIWYYNQYTICTVMHVLWGRQDVAKWDGFGLLSSYQQLMTGVSFGTTIKNIVSTNLASDMKYIHICVYIYIARATKKVAA